MKLRVLYHGKDGNAYAMAEKFSREYRCTCDKIPPAYPCEGEILLLLGAETSKKNAPRELIEFCKTLDAKRTKNVAFFTVGTTSAENVAEMKEVLEKNGVNVCADVFNVPAKSGLFKKASITEGDLEDSMKWADKVVDSLFDRR